MAEQAKVAIVHYWLNGMRGGEKVLESLCRLYPEADIYTHAYEPDKISDTINRHNIFTTFIAKLPLSKKKYQAYLPLMPTALEELDLSKYDLVISSESGPAKGVITRPDAVHICYCHSPMRYVWDMYHEYVAGKSLFKRLLISPLIHYLKFWDALSANRVDYFIANSSYIAKRIRKLYRRSATVINPPVDFDAFYTSETTGDYYLLLGQLVPYKKADMAVEAFKKSGKRLIVVGEGECKKDILKQAQGYDNIEILGKQPFSEICRLYAECKALIFPGIEDFGIVPLEAMASGRPVIAYAKGGVLDSVKDGETGLFYHQQTADALVGAVEHFETETYDSNTIREHARTFSIANFEAQLTSFINNKLEVPVNHDIDYAPELVEKV